MSAQFQQRITCRFLWGYCVGNHASENERDEICSLVVAALVNVGGRCAETVRGGGGGLPRCPLAGSGLADVVHYLGLRIPVAEQVLDEVVGNLATAVRHVLPLVALTESGQRRRRGRARGVLMRFLWVAVARLSVRVWRERAASVKFLAVEGVERAVLDHLALASFELRGRRAWLVELCELCLLPGVELPALTQLIVLERLALSGLQGLFIVCRRLLVRADQRAGTHGRRAGTHGRRAVGAG